MANNLFIGADAQIRFSLQTLRAQEGGGSVIGDITDIHGDIFLSNDPQSNVSGEYKFSKDGLVYLKMRPSGTESPRWQALHLRMGPSGLDGAGVIGVVARSSAPTAMVTRFCLRSGRDGEFIDTFFPKAMASFSEPSTHLDIMELDLTPDIPRTADWRELILFFRTGHVELALLDLRLFIV